MITVDGPAASGKSTVARRLAESLGFHYVNSGALYRAIALAVSRQPQAIESEEEMANLLGQVTVEFRSEERTFLDNEDVSEAIRTKEVSVWASRVATLPAVREQVNTVLHQIASKTHSVIDGRDIGTVVFPDADFKIYLEASLDERSRRRLRDYQKAGRTALLEDIMAELSDRDQADSSRKVAPLQLPKDATVVNSTDRSVEQVVTDLLAKAHQAFAAQGRDIPEITIGVDH